jgi:hypothetical protein
VKSFHPQKAGGADPLASIAPAQIAVMAQKCILAHLASGVDLDGLLKLSRINVLCAKVLMHHLEVQQEQQRRLHQLQVTSYLLEQRLSLLATIDQ